jgi:Na+/H+ antiporter NhaD/arsenite permease-like protein
MSRRWTAGSAGELATLTAVGLLLLVALGSAALLIFAASYLALAIGKVPGLSIDRAGVALVGACLMVASGVMTLDEAYQSIDLGTITLLLGMMTSWPICGSPASSRCSTRG